MNLKVLHGFEWDRDTSYGKGQVINIDDVELARAMVKLSMVAPADDAAAWAIANTGAPAPRRAAWAGHTTHTAPLRMPLRAQRA
jgi:hypothetical protein